MKGRLSLPQIKRDIIDSYSTNILQKKRKNNSDNSKINGKYPLKTIDLAKNPKIKRFNIVIEQ